MANDIWPMVFAERRALADDLAGLRDDQWSTPSLCDQWSVREVLAHMTATAQLSPVGFFGAMIGSGFNIKKMQDKHIAQRVAGLPSDTLNRFRSVQTSQMHPPGPADTWLGEVMVHCEDIRRPLGIAHTYPQPALERVAAFYRRSNLLIGGKRRTAGLTLRATDTDWVAGNGPEVRGPMVSLVMATVGRGAVLEDLDGDGLEALRARM